MQDEYGDMTADGHTYVHPVPFCLENGQALEQAQLRYQTYGSLNPERSNVIVVCHALTGNASLHAWWGDMLGADTLFDTNKYFIICCNILGSCYGSTNPNSINPGTGNPYGIDFPDVSVQDNVRLQLHLLADELKLSSVHCVIGGSFGGMQALEFAVQGRTRNGSAIGGASPFVKSAVVIACGSSHTAWQIGISEVQRQAIYADPNWNLNPMQAKQGLAIARQIGMVSYRTPKGYRSHFGRRVMPNKNETRPQQTSCTSASMAHCTNNDNTPDGTEAKSPPKYGSKANWSVKSYLEYQGQKFLPRFDPVTYVKLTEQMDSHDVARNRAENVAEALAQVDIPVLVIGIDSDVLYPLEEQEEIAELLPKGELCVIYSDHGHDGFLLEQDQMSRHITSFLEQRNEEKRHESKNNNNDIRQATVLVPVKKPRTLLLNTQVTAS